MRWWAATVTAAIAVVAVVAVVRIADTARSDGGSSGFPASADGRFAVASGVTPSVGSGRSVTYSVEVERGLPYRADEVAGVVDTVLSDPRSWTAVDPVALRRVPLFPDVHVRLASPRTTDALCAPLRTGGRLSCRNGSTVVLNAWRWTHGATAYRGDLTRYRVYMVNHEFGHALGHGHTRCPDPGEPAPVMLQQTLGLTGCRPNPWPAVR